ncbi:ATP-binding protein [Lentisphaera profundi]|uniref:histidine kinase n=1 Tax=Lentisphaera profundi TaxID=1658616 RepID=A0ABY7VZB9_9BACT|nr:ATP-binding protein [Lentisphaera profundi]WDE98064.1 ATP-binding protein [Lentisphaera profundi]
MIVLGNVTVKAEACVLALRKKFYTLFKMFAFEEVCCSRKVSFLSELLRQLDCKTELLIKIERQSMGAYLCLELSRENKLNLPFEVFFTEVCDKGDKLILKDFLGTDFQMIEQEVEGIRGSFNKKTVEELLLELEHKNAELADHGTLLEEKVFQRTQEAEKARAEAEKANVEKSQFLSNMSHELRTPLNGVLGYTQVLQNSPDLQTKYQSSLKGIMNCGEHLLTVINDILDISKIEAGKLELFYDEVDISRIVNETEDILRYKALEKNLSLGHSLNPEIPQYIQSDVTKLRQILVNLVGNAVKYTSTGSVDLKVEIQGQYLKFLVIDTGIGIPAEKQKRVFEAFRQDEGGRKEGGTGLGLAICVKLVEALGGEIGLESEEGKGSSFWFTHPAKFEGVAKLGEKTEGSLAKVSLEEVAHGVPVLEMKELSLDQAWLKDLEQATILGDFSELETLAMKLSDQVSEASLKEIILEKANAFDFDAIQKIIDDYKEVSGE